MEYKIYLDLNIRRYMYLLYN